MKQALQTELDSALKAVVAEMQTAVSELTLVLEGERAALDAADSAALNRAGTRKQALMLQLEQLDGERQQLGRESPASAETLKTEWTRILLALRACQQANLRNGNQVNQQLHQVRQALSILTGHTGESNLYSRDGGVHVNLRSRMLAQA